MVTQHRTIVLFICFVKQAGIDGDFGLVPRDHRELTCLLAEYDRSTWVLLIAFTNELRTVLPPSEYLHHKMKKRLASLPVSRETIPAFDSTDSLGSKVSVAPKAPPRPQTWSPWRGRCYLESQRVWTVHSSTRSEDGDRAAETAGPGGNPAAVQLVQESAVAFQVLPSRPGARCRGVLKQVNV